MNANNTLRVIAILVIVALGAWGVHFYGVSLSRDVTAEAFKFLHISYGFLLFLSIGLMGLTLYVHKQDPAKGGMAYLVGSVIKMLLALVFLLPIIFQKHEDARLIALNFIAAYFIFLIVEVVLALKVLRAK